MARREVSWAAALTAGLVVWMVLRALRAPGPQPLPSGPPAGPPAPVATAAPGPVGRRALGVQTRSAPEGLVVAVVASGGSAWAAGILPGDLLLSAGGVSLARSADGTRGEVRLKQALEALPPDQPLLVELLRGGERRRLEVPILAEGSLELPLADELIQAAVEQLLALRRPDGFWPGYLDPQRPGAATTALAAWALSRAPAHPGAAEARRQALALLLRECRTSDGAPARGVEDRFAPHPHRTYATACALLAATGLPGHEADVDELGRWLAWAQVGETHGVEAFDATYGGWSYYDDHRGHDVRRRRADVSTARFALQALAAAGLPPEASTWSRAELYLDATQNLTLLSRPEDAWRARERALRDGGFAFSPQSSKAGEQALEEDLLVVHSSYGSATADGALALLCCRGQDLRAAADPGPPRIEDLRARAGLAWLASRWDLEEIPGFPPEAVGWRRAMLFYYRAALAELLHRAGVWRVVQFDGAAHVWAAELVRTLKNHHNRLGTFRGESALMKEDSPVLAASFALLALSAARDRLRLGRGADLVAEGPPPPSPLAPEPPAGDVLARGQALFRRDCAACHDDEGAGNAPPLPGVADRYTAAWGPRAGPQLLRWLRDPRPGGGLMGGGKTWPTRMEPVVLGQEDLEALVAWLLTRSAGLPVSGQR